MAITRAQVANKHLLLGDNEGMVVRDKNFDVVALPSFCYRPNRESEATRSHASTNYDGVSQLIKIPRTHLAVNRPPLHGYLDTAEGERFEILDAALMTVRSMWHINVNLTELPPSPFPVASGTPGLLLDGQDGLTELRLPDGSPLTWSA